MSQSSTESTTDEYVYIDLDRPKHWWNSLFGLIAITLIVGVLVAPWAIDWGDSSTHDIATNSMQNSSSVCRPNSSGIPGFFDPTVASWSRFCEWFIDPSIDSP